MAIETGDNTGGTQAACLDGLATQSLDSHSISKSDKFPFTHPIASSAKPVQRAGYLLELLTIFKVITWILN